MKIAKKKRYIVGFGGKVIYGKGSPGGRYDFTHSMTIKQATRELLTLTGRGRKIFRLVEVDPATEQASQ